MSNKKFFDENYANDYNLDSNFSARIKKAEKDLSGLKISNKNRSLDIGAGPGAYSFALANLGFKEVVALDYSQTLLDLLNKRNNNENNIITMKANIVDIGKLKLEKYDFINLTGDTILYLENQSSIANLFRSIKDLLNLEALLYIQFRDFSKTEKLIDRFKVTHQSDNYSKIISMNYEGDYIYTVDLVQKKVNEEWTFEKGVNKKLRISEIEILDMLQNLGYKLIEKENKNGNIKITCSVDN